MLVVWDLDGNVAQRLRWVTWWWNESWEWLCLTLGDDDWHVKLRWVGAVASFHLEINLLLVLVGDHLDLAAWNQILTDFLEVNFDILLGLITWLASLV